MNSTGLMTLAEAASVDAEQIGGKAAVLARLLTAGLPVPPGFVITEDAFAMADRDLDAAIAIAAAGLGAGPFAVRSSAAAEDLTDASYAGLYETFLNVPTAELAAAVRRCHAAAYAPRVSTYQQHRISTPGAGRVWRCWSSRSSRRHGGGGIHRRSGHRRPRSHPDHRRPRPG